MLELVDELLELFDELLELFVELVELLVFLMTVSLPLLAFFIALAVTEAEKAEVCLPEHSAELRNLLNVIEDAHAPALAKINFTIVLLRGVAFVFSIIQIKNNVTKKMYFDMIFKVLYLKE